MARRISSGEKRGIVRNAMRQFRRAAGSSIFRQFGKIFGPMGELIGMVTEILSGGKQPSRDDLDQAIDILTESGYEVSPPSGEPIQPGDIEPPPIVSPRRGDPATPRNRGRDIIVPSVDAIQTVAQPGAEPWPDEEEIAILPRRIRGAYETIPEDIKEFSPWILTPDSTNVYAFAYDYGEGILYVQFRAYGEPEGYRDSISICTGRAYKMAIRPNQPGSIYSYGGAGRPVSPELFDEFVKARSVGKKVWDKLRVCGSQWMHQLPYTLVDTPQGQYIPRKATRRGLRVRTVPQVGMGRRGGRRSSFSDRIR